MERRRKARFAITGMSCSGCAGSVTNGITTAIKTVNTNSSPCSVELTSCHVDVFSSIATVDYTICQSEGDEEESYKRLVQESIESTLSDIGFEAELVNDDDVQTNNTRSKPKRKVMEATLALDGLTCSACESAVTRAVLTSPRCLESGAETGGGEAVILRESVVVSLFPEPRLKFRYYRTDREDTDEMKIEEEMVDIVEGIGFGATVLSSERVADPSGTLDGDLEGGRNGSGGDEDGSKERTRRTVYVEVEKNGRAVLEAWKARCATAEDDLEREIVRVEMVKSPFSSSSSKSGKLTSKLTSKLTRNRNKLDSQNGQGPCSSLQSTPGGTIQLTYNPQLIGIRTLVENIQYSSSSSSEFDTCTSNPLIDTGTVTVTDASSFQNNQKASEQRRRAEISRWRTEFLVALAFSLPVAIISMVFMHLPHLGPFFHSYAVWTITREELATWILATPVQFISGARFYKEAYHNVRSRRLGMSFLIAVGTSAAYCYSVFVVLYNAARANINKDQHSHTETHVQGQNGHMEKEERLMQAFETSALLITFVLLGKYLECKAKGYASRAIAELAGLSPDSATLIGTMPNVNHALNAFYLPVTNTTTSNSDLTDTITKQMQPLPEQSIPLSLVQKHDVLLVRPGEKIPTDGILIPPPYSTTTTSDHAATIDESMLTGESIPATKLPGDRVTGGTINLSSPAHIVVAVHSAQDATLAQIVRLVEQAQTARAPIQDVSDRISSRFVPFVFVVSMIAGVTWAVLLNAPGSPLTDETKHSWPYRDEGWTDVTLPLLFVISVLVIACPCAMGLATPAAVMVGSGVGAKFGILIKGGGEALERSRGIGAVVFDKTGTLTVGKPGVEEVLLLSDRCAGLRLWDKGDGADVYDDGNVTTKTNENDSVASTVSSATNKEKSNDVVTNGFFSTDLCRETVKQSTMENILFLAACAEHGSEHPLAKGILAKAAEHGMGEGMGKPFVPVDNFVSETGSGIRCSIKGHTVHIGNRRCLEANNINITLGTYDAMEYLEERGQTSIVVSVDGRTEAVIGLIDKAKDEASLTVGVLQKVMGIKVYMLTGDNFRTARVVANEIGIASQNVIADVLPEGKVDCIQRLQEEFRGKRRVAMIGDGVNDSPALAQADVGIAIGAGTDVAIETAQVVLMNSKLTDVIVAIDLARTIYSRIWLNFVWALGYNTLAIPIAAGAMYPVVQKALPPFMAAIAMVLSSLSVLFSSLLLNRYKPPKFDKKYGRKLREGKLGLESVRVIAGDGTDVTFQVSTCEGMKNGGPCCCPEGECKCHGCEKHNTTQVPALSKTNGKDNFYPGCGAQWDKSCACSPCQCKVVCMCGSSVEGEVGTCVCSCGSNCEQCGGGGGCCNTGTLTDVSSVNS